MPPLQSYCRSDEGSVTPKNPFMPVGTGHPYVTVNPSRSDKLTSPNILLSEYLSKQRLVRRHMKTGDVLVMNIVV